MNKIHSIIRRAVDSHVVASKFVNGKKVPSVAKRTLACVISLTLGAMASQAGAASLVAQNTLNFTDSQTGTPYSIIRVAFDPATLVANTGAMYAYSQTWGPTSQVGGRHALAIGDQSNAAGAQSSALGANAMAAENSTAVGSNAVADGSNAVAIGMNAHASGDSDIALGANSVAQGAIATSGTTIAHDNYSFAGATPVGTLSVGSIGFERTITNVAAGRLSSNSTDAVNGSQLYATNQAVDTLDGRMTSFENTFNQMSSSTTNQAGMFQTSTDSKQPPITTGSNSAAGGSDAVATGNGSLALGNGAQATADNSVAIGNQSVADRANAVSVGSAGSERQITNVAAGTQATDAVNMAQFQAAQAGTVHYDTNADGSTNTNSITLNQGGSATGIHNVAAGTATTDAVNVGQLGNAMSQTQDWAKSYTDRQVNQMGKRASAGTASAMAMAGLPQAIERNQGFGSAAISSYGGQSSIAVGLSSVSASGRYVVKVSGSANTKGDLGITVGGGLALW